MRVPFGVEETQTHSVYLHVVIRIVIIAIVPIIELRPSYMYHHQPFKPCNAEDADSFVLINAVPYHSRVLDSTLHVAFFPVEPFPTFDFIQISIK